MTKKLPLNWFSSSAFCISCFVFLYFLFLYFCALCFSELIFLFFFLRKYNSGCLKSWFLSCSCFCISQNWFSSSSCFLLIFSLDVLYGSHEADIDAYCGREYAPNFDHIQTYPVLPGILIIILWIFSVLYVKGQWTEKRPG